MPEVPPVMRIVLECIFMKSSPIIRGDRFALVLIISAGDFTAPHIRRANHDTIRVAGSFSVRVFCCPLARATARAAGRRLLPIEALAEDGGVGLLRREDSSSA